MKSAVIWLSGLAVLQHVAALCNVCNSNGVACTSDKDFYLCENGQPNTTKLYSCSGDKICTKDRGICAARTADSTRLGCGDPSNCGICDGAASSGSYACTSRTTYTMCLDGKLTNIRGTCPKYEICDIVTGKKGMMPCVPDCKQNIEFCDLNEAIDAPVVTTQSPVIPTTSTQAPSTSPPISAELCAQYTLAGYYPNPNDATCRSYIFCFWRNSVLQGRKAECQKSYFSPTLRRCVLGKPAGCI